MGFRCVSFSLGEEHFGLHLDDVVHIVRCEHILPVPGAPALVEGMLNLRGEVVPLINLRRLLGLGEAVAGRRQRVIIIRREARILGLLVDSVREIRVDDADYRPSASRPAEKRTGLANGAVLGVVKTEQESFTLLDIFVLLSGLPQAAQGRRG